MDHRTDAASEARTVYEAPTVVSVPLDEGTVFTAAVVTSSMQPPSQAPSLG